MKTFKEIFIERYYAEGHDKSVGKDPGFSDSVSEVFFEFAGRVADEYKEQFIVKPEQPTDNPLQTNLFHHQV